MLRPYTFPQRLWDVPERPDPDRWGERMKVGVPKETAAKERHAALLRCGLFRDPDLHAFSPSVRIGTFGNVPQSLREGVGAQHAAPLHSPCVIPSAARSVPAPGPAAAPRNRAARRA